ncbi:MAG: hypothetical protein V2A76_12275 [Planctomycetota bacterium]
MAILFSLAGCSKEYVLDKLSLSDEAVPIVKALAEDPVFPMKRPLEIGIVSRAEMEDALYGEILPTARKLGMEEKRAESLAREQSRGMSREVGVKFFSERYAVLVIPENVVKAARELAESEDVTRELLRGRLLVECAHAAAFERYGLDRMAGDSAEMDRRMARSAAMEGFAWFLARRLAERKGWMRSLDLCARRVVGERPKTIRSIRDAAADEAYRQLSFIHVAGERFVTTLFETGGEPAIARMFEAPPEDPDLIARPEWYLDPSSRPQPTRELEAALSLFEERFDQAVWQIDRMVETRQRIAAQLASRGEQDVQRMLDGIVAGRASVASSREDPAARNVVLQIKEHTSAEAANFFVLKVRQILESDRTGNIKPFEDEGERWAGFLFAESAASTGGPEILGCVVASGVLTVSISFAGEAVVEQTLREVVELVLDAIR